jgi:hypothetical protein
VKIVNINISPFILYPLLIVIMGVVACGAVTHVASMEGISLTERSTNLTKISNSIEKTQNRLINGSVNVVKATLTMIG